MCNPNIYYHDWGQKLISGHRGPSYNPKVLFGMPMWIIRSFFLSLALHQTLMSCHEPGNHCNSFNWGPEFQISHKLSRSTSYQINHLNFLLLPLHNLLEIHVTTFHIHYPIFTKFFTHHYGPSLNSSTHVFGSWNNVTYWTQLISTFSTYMNIEQEDPVAHAATATFFDRSMNAFLTGWQRLGPFIAACSFNLTLPLQG